MIHGPISLRVNGKERQLSGEVTLPDLLSTLGVDGRLVAVAVNEEVVNRDRYAEIELHDGDTIEVVRMVGGG